MLRHACGYKLANDGHDTRAAGLPRAQEYSAHGALHRTEPDAVQGFLAGMSHNEEPELNVSPAADEAMRKLVELFSDPAVVARAHFRCSTEGLTDLEVMLGSILDDQFGHDPNSEYKNWIRRLYDLGLIPRIPSDWEAPETPRKSPV